MLYEVCVRVSGSEKTLQFKVKNPLEALEIIDLTYPELTMRKVEITGRKPWAADAEFLTRHGKIVSMSFLELPDIS